MKPNNLLPAAALCLLLLAGCGNKGPLVRPSDIPPPAEGAPAVAPAAAPAPAPDEAPLPDLAPPAQPPVTEAATPPPATETPAPPPAQGDGG